MSDKLKIKEATSVTVKKVESSIKGVYHTQVLDKDGNLKFEDVSPNVVPTIGQNAILDLALGAATNFTASTCYMSLTTAGSASAGSTYASPGVTEATSSIISARTAVTWVAASAGSKSTASISFTTLSSATITGNMIVFGGSSPSTVNDQAGGGTLLSATSFTSGSLSVTSGDIINVVYTISL